MTQRSARAGGGRESRDGGTHWPEAPATTTTARVRRQGVSLGHDLLDEGPTRLCARRCRMPTHLAPCEQPEAASPALPACLPLRVPASATPRQAPALRGRQDLCGRRTQRAAAPAPRRQTQGPPSARARRSSAQRQPARRPRRRSAQGQTGPRRSGSRKRARMRGKAAATRCERNDCRDGARSTTDQRARGLQPRRQR
jgi:hypothetical protein